MPNGSKLLQDEIGQGRTCQWPYTGYASVQRSGGRVERLALFVRLDQPRTIALQHDCERSAGTDQSELRFEQPLLEGLYSPRGELFVRCYGWPAACPGAPRLLQMTAGGVANLIREFGIIAVPASEIAAAYSGLAENGLSAQQAIDQAEAAITRRRPGVLPP